MHVSLLEFPIEVLRSDGGDETSADALHVALVRVALTFAVLGCAEEVVELLEALLLQITNAHVVGTASSLCALDAIVGGDEWRTATRVKYSQIARALDSSALIRSGDDVDVESLASNDSDAHVRLPRHWCHGCVAVTAEPVVVSAATACTGSSDALGEVDLEVRTPSQLNIGAGASDITADDLVRPVARTVARPTRAQRTAPVHVAAAECSKPLSPPPALPSSLHTPLARLRATLHTSHARLSSALIDLCRQLSIADGTLVRELCFFEFKTCAPIHEYENQTMFFLAGAPCNCDATC